MKHQARRILATIAVGIASSSLLFAETFTFADGTQIDGEIYRVTGDNVTIVDSEGSKSTHDFSQFQKSHQASIKSWKASNPDKVDVHTKWDTQPIIVSSSLPRLPEKFLDSSFEGDARVELILDESGQVIHASVKETSHEALKEPSIEAVKSWKFEPALIDGKAVKSKIRVPFQFKNTVPEKSFIDNFRPDTVFKL